MEYMGTAIFLGVALFGIIMYRWGYYNGQKSACTDWVNHDDTHVAERGIN